MPDAQLFVFPYLTSQSVPYSATDTAQMSATVDGGVLSKHRTVWLKESREACSNERNERIVPAFVEKVGVVLIDARYLVDLSFSLLNSMQARDRSRSNSPSYSTGTASNSAVDRLFSSIEFQPF
jgi:hypothetical protein